MISDRASIIPEDRSFKYKAFLSYSRRDRASAVKLQRELEAYVLPRALQRSGARNSPARRPLKPLFRDESDLLAGADLPQRILAGLMQSQFLIVVCSPYTNRSEWVEREIVDFIRLFGRSRVLVVVVDGAPNAVLNGFAAELECLPPALRYELDPAGNLTEVPAEPYWIDRRNGSGDRRNSFLRMVGFLLSLDSLDELILRDRQAERRRQRITKGIAALGIILTSISMFMLAVGEQTRNNALISQSLFLARDSVSATAEGNARLGALLALRALPANLRRPNRPYVAAAGVALSGALANLHEERTLSDNPSQHFNKVVYSPDGRTVAGAGNDGSVTLYDLRTGTVAGQFKVDMRGPPHGTDLITLEYSPDGRQIVVGCQDLSVKILDVSTGRELSSFQYDEVIVSVSFAKDMSGILVQSVHSLFWWRPNTSKTETITTTNRSYNSVSQSADGSLALVSGSDELSLWDLARKTRIRAYSIPTSSITGADISQDAKSFIVSSASDVTIYNTATGAENFKLARGAYFGYARLTKDAAVVLDQGDVNLSDPVIRVFDMQGGTVAQMRPGERRISSIALSPDGEHLVTASWDGNLRLWSLKSRYQTRSFPASVISPDFRRFASKGFQPTLQDVAPSNNSHPTELSPPIPEALGNFSADGQRIALWNFGESALLYDAQTGVKIADLSNKIPLRIMFSPDHRRLVTRAIIEEQVQLLDGDTGRLIRNLNLQARVCFSAFSADGKRLVTTGYGPTVTLWDSNSGDHLMDLVGHKRGVCSAQFSADNARLATASGDGTVRIWDLSTGRTLTVLSGHQEAVNQVVLSPDGRQAATASYDLTVRLWDLKNGRTVSLLTGHRNTVNAIAYSRDGRRLATAGQDGAVMVWDTVTGRLEVTLVTGNPVLAVEFAPASNVLFITTASRGIVWRTPETCQTLIDEADQTVRNLHFSLTETERAQAFVFDRGTGMLSNIYAAIRPALTWMLPRAGDRCSSG